MLEDRIFKNEISSSEIADIFSEKKEDNTEILITMLTRALEEMNPSAVETLLYAASCNGELDNRYTKVLSELLLEPKILNHNLESVVEFLQYIQDPASIENLYYACLDYPFSDVHSIPIKAMWALRDIGSVKAIEKLKILSQSSDERMNEKAIQQLEYLRQKEEST